MTRFNKSSKITIQENGMVTTNCGYLNGLPLRAILGNTRIEKSLTLTRGNVMLCVDVYDRDGNKIYFSRRDIESYYQYWSHFDSNNNLTRIASENKWIKDGNICSHRERNKYYYNSENKLVFTIDNNGDFEAIISINDGYLVLAKEGRNISHYIC